MERRRMIEFYIETMSKCKFDEECASERIAEVMKKAMEAVINGDAPKTVEQLKILSEQFMKLVDMFYWYFYGSTFRRWWE